MYIASSHSLNRNVTFSNRILFACVKYILLSFGGVGVCPKRGFVAKGSRSYFLFFCETMSVRFNMWTVFESSNLRDDAETILYQSLIPFSRRRLFRPIFKHEFPNKFCGSVKWRLVDNRNLRRPFLIQNSYCRKIITSVSERHSVRSTDNWNVLLCFKM